MKFIIVQSMPALIFLFFCVVCSAEGNRSQGIASGKEVVTANKKNNDNKVLFSNSDISSEKIIDSKGGVATLEGIVSVYFSENALPSDTKVTLSAGLSKEIDDVFNETTIMFGEMERLSQDVRINTGKEPPSSEYILAKMYIENISSRFRISELSVFIGFEQGGSEEIPTMAFDAVEYSYNQQEKTLTFNIPGAAFTSNELASGSYQATIILAAHKNN